MVSNGAEQTGSSGEPEDGSGFSCRPFLLLGRVRYRCNRGREDLLEGLLLAPRPMAVVWRVRSRRWLGRTFFDTALVSLYHEAAGGKHWRRG